ncbi:MAG: chemotaxis protein CheX [Bacteriovoracaceae bacterium]|nr:chemotaxis protein CheX [Bacteriovoracaceae bacterium]
MKSFQERYLEFCKPFVDGLKNVYSTMVFTEIKHRTPQLKRESCEFSDYSSVMGINGVFESEESKPIDFKGSLVISWPMDTYLKTSSKMLMEEYSEFDDDIKDVGMEISNIAMGNAKKIVNPLGYKIEMSVPNCIVGKDHSVDSEKGTVTIIIPFESDLGPFYMEINYKDSESE